jgi:hypothetical protein
LRFKAHFINDPGDLNGRGVVLFARHPTGLKLREQRLAYYAALPDDTHTNNSKRGAQCSGEFIGCAPKTFYLRCVVKNYISWRRPIHQIHPQEKAETEADKGKRAQSQT